MIDYELFMWVVLPMILLAGLALWVIREDGNGG
jgi:hypothetical protein